MVSYYLQFMSLCDILCFPITLIHTSLLDASLTLMSSGSFMKLWLLKGAALRLMSSGSICLPSFCLSTPSWFPCLSSSCTSGSLSFFRFALLTEASSEKRLTRGRSDGDLSVVESGLWISVDERDERWGLKHGHKHGCVIGICFVFLIAWIKNTTQAN